MRETEGTRNEGEGRAVGKDACGPPVPSFICGGPALPLPGVNYSRLSPLENVAAARRNAGTKRLASG
jgi:hypothetical protein